MKEEEKKLIDKDGSRKVEKSHFSDSIKNAHASGDGALNRGNEAIEIDREEGTDEQPGESTY